MSISIYRAVSVGALGGVAAFLAEGPVAQYGAQLFPVLIGLAGYYHFGGKLEGLKKSLLHYLAGVILAAAASIIAARFPYGAELGAAPRIAIAVAVTLGVLVFASRLTVSNDFPVAVLGYAALIGLAGGSERADRLLTLSHDNPFVVAILSLYAGAIFALLSDYLAEALQKYGPLPGQRTRSATSV